MAAPEEDMPALVAARQESDVTNFAKARMTQFYNQFHYYVAPVLPGMDPNMRRRFLWDFVPKDKEEEEE